MKKIILSVVAVNSLGFSGGDFKEVEPALIAVPAIVEEGEDKGLYVGLGYSHLSHDTDFAGRGMKIELDYSAIMLSAGYKFNPYFAMEGRYWSTMGDPDTENTLVVEDVSPSMLSSNVSVFSIFAKPTYPIAPKMDIYGLLGYSFTNVENEGVTSVDEDSFSWGAGASYDIDEHFSLFAEYTQFYNDSLNGFDHVVDSFNLGVIYQFSGYTAENILPAVATGTKILEEENFYLGAGIVAVSVRDTSASMDIFRAKPGQERLGNAMLLAGYEFSNYLAVEGRYATALTDADTSEMTGAWSIFLKPTYKFEDDEERAVGDDYFAVYALLGYGGITLEGTNQYVVDIDDTGFQWGLGLSYTFRTLSDKEDYKHKDSWTVFADYANLANDMDGLFYNGANKIDADAFTVGVSYKF